MSLGCLMSVISKIRTPRTRSVLTVSLMPPGMQSARLPFPSDDRKRRLRNAETSFCDAGHGYVAAIVGFDGTDMSHTWNPA